MFCSQDEQSRIEDLGGSVIFWGTWRVNGQLAVSRAIGECGHRMSQPFVLAHTVRSVDVSLLPVRVVFREPVRQPAQGTLGPDLVHLCQPFDQRRADVFLQVPLVVVVGLLGQTLVQDVGHHSFGALVVRVRVCKRTRSGRSGHTWSRGGRTHRLVRSECGGK